MRDEDASEDATGATSTNRRELFRGPSLRLRLRLRLYFSLAQVLPRPTKKTEETSPTTRRREVVTTGAATARTHAYAL